MTTLLLLAWWGQSDDLVQQFLQGKEGAGHRLVGRGFAALPDLLEARGTADGKAREALLDHIFEIKRTTLDEADEDGRKVFAELDATKLDLNIQVPTNADWIDLLRDILGLNFVVDPDSLGQLTRSLAVKAEGAVARSVLDQVCVAAGLDYDWRYGVLWLARPDRLWRKVQPLTEAGAEELRNLFADLEKIGLQKLKLKGKDDLTAPQEQELRDLESEMRIQETTVRNAIRRRGPGSLPLLETLADKGSPSIGGIYEDLRKWFRGIKWAISAVPLDSAAVSVSAGPIQEKIRGTRITLEFSQRPFEEVLGFLRDFTGLNLLDLSGRSGDPITLKVKDVTLADAFAMLTLPRGVDLEIRDAVVVLIDPAKPRGPRVNRWKNQDLDSTQEALAARLESVKMDLDFAEKTPLNDILTFLSESLQLKFTLESGTLGPTLGIRVRNISLEHILAWITLPYGLDARIENGGIVVYQRKKE